jgi:putative nucleotidyltransferase with HDIG domain
MEPLRSYLTAGRLYLYTIIAAGLFVALHSLIILSETPVGFEWFVLAGLTLLSGSFTVKIPTIPARLSVSETFVFTAVLLFGPAAATLIVALDSLVISLWIYRKSRKALRVLFNLSAPTVAVWLAAECFFFIAGIRPISEASTSILPLLAPLACLAVVYFLLNSWLIAIAVGLDQHVSPLKVWRANFLWLSLNYFSGASVAALLLPYFASADHFAILRVIGILLPLLLISYLTFKTALGRVDDANRHLDELNRLYMSTIETLAMAIDAKDQVTHGHIRRVQTFAVGLARHMGLADQEQIKAVEAAALLHDMGKLAVPEYILNKPGPLTPAEFDKMKLHASVGADILSAIDFPYPVVPIVRHHHENWDGSGYPDGLAGSDIPIGARILSVVDCFDALTSDRPYRPRLSDTEALRIIAERRGVMYDPIVVDTFARIYRSIAPEQTDHMTPQGGLSAITRGSASVITASKSGLGDISASTEEMVLLYELARSLMGRQDLSATAELVSKHLRRLIPATTSAFFLKDEERDELFAAYISGENASYLSSLRIPIGQRLSGWVAANQQTILNSDATLDLGEAGRALRPPLRSSLSAPLLVENKVIGVLTLYSTQTSAFSDEHGRLIEAIARQVAQPLHEASKTHLTTDQRASPLLVPVSWDDSRAALAAHLSATGTASLIVISLHPTRSVRDDELDEAVRNLAELVKFNLCEGDAFLLCERTNIVVVSTGRLDIDSAASVETSIALAFSKNAAQFEGIAVRVGHASAPQDGSSASQLLALANERSTGTDGQGTYRRSIH